MIKTASGQSLGLTTNLIADSLLTNSNAVVRFHKTNYERISASSYNKHIHYAITILSSAGERHAPFVTGYDRTSKITNIKGFIHDKNGKVIKKLKKKDITDIAINNSFTLFSDNRLKYFEPNIKTYPYTVEYSYTEVNTSTIAFSPWLPQSGNKLSIEKAQLNFTTPNALEFKYKALNYPFAFKKTQQASKTTYQWKAKPMKATKRVKHAPHNFDFVPMVLISPSQIEYEGFKGDFSDWQNFGLWIKGLTKGRTELPEETIKKVREMTADIEKPKDKVKAIYKYMQSKTRYVNIALGIGGFQPLHAKDVDEKGYGDCKALSNYSKALLEAIGIPAHLVIIGNGRDREVKFTDFSSANQMNHAILCVPLEQDTVWLECTSQTMPFGYVGGGNSNRYAILITEEGGKLARTPHYKTKENKRASNIDIELTADGGANFQINSTFSNYSFQAISYLIHVSPKEQREYILESLSGQGISLNNLSIEDITEGYAKGRLKIDGKIGKYATKAGSRLIFQPEYLLKQRLMKTISSKRELDLYQPIGYTYQDTLSIKLPEKYSIEYLPENKTFSSVYGEYNLTYKTDGDVFQILSTLQVNDGTFKKKDFEGIKSFIKDVHRSKSKKIVLINKQT